MLEIFFGIISGTISSLGMGGGTILILLLNLFSHIEQHIAQATNLVFFIPTSIVAIIMNIKNKNINWKISSIVVFFGIIGAIIGSLISVKLSNQNLRKYFGVFLIFITIYQIYAFYKQYIKKVKEE